MWFRFAVVQLKCRVVSSLIQMLVTKALNARLMGLMTHFTASRNDVDDYTKYSTRKQNKQSNSISEVWAQAKDREMPTVNILTWKEEILIMKKDAPRQFFRIQKIVATSLHVQRIKCASNFNNFHLSWLWRRQPRKFESPSSTRKTIYSHYR